MGIILKALKDMLKHWESESLIENRKMTGCNHLKELIDNLDKSGSLTNLYDWESSVVCMSLDRMENV